MSALRELLFRLLRIPGPPEPPPGEGASVRVFRASRRFYQYSLARWALAQAGTALGLLGGFVALSALPDGGAFVVLDVLEWLAVAGFVAQLPVTFLITRFDYEMRWYVLTDRSMRIREGIVTVREKTITFANVQNITVRQGPLQRLLGIRDVEVRTAGGGEGKGHGEGGVGEPMHVGYFRGVDQAEEIRDAIREGVRRHRDAGLGDPDDRAPAPAPALPADSGAELAAAAREMLAEARALRAAATG